MDKCLLNDLKWRLCEIAQRETDLYDLTELEYLLNLIDGFLIGYLDMSTESIKDFIESVITVAIMQVRFDLLDYVKPLTKEESFGKI